MSETLQEQVAATKRAHILGAAARVFAEKGFHATTVRDVARAAGVADGTIYNHFENKAALLLGLIDPMSRGARQAPDPGALAGLSLRDFVRAHLLGPLGVFGADNFELFRVIVSELMVNAEVRALFRARVLTPMLGLAEEAFGRWAEANRAEANGAPPPATRLTVRVLSGLVFGLILQRVMGDDLLAEDWETLPDALADLLVHGLAGEPG